MLNQDSKVPSPKGQGACSYQGSSPKEPKESNQGIPTESPDTVLSRHIMAWSVQANILIYLCMQNGTHICPNLCRVYCSCLIV